MTVPFNKPAALPESLDYMQEAMRVGHISGDGLFTGRCSRWLEENTGAEKVLLTTSCSHALDMAAYLCGVDEGDEVIMPSFTFPSTANAFVAQGASVVFVDIRPDTMNMDETLLEAAITPNTRAIVPVHYAGVACDMDAINEIASAYDLLVVEDAAQGVMARYKGRPLGALGHLGTFSFHETKNYTMGEGGALVVNSPGYVEQAEIVREKGTDRSRFFRGQVDKYRWVSWGSSYLPSELNTAYLWAQLEQAEAMNQGRLASWNAYYEALQPLAQREVIQLPCVPGYCTHNAHMFYIKLQGLAQRDALSAHMAQCGVQAIYHYVPLHSAPAGRAYGWMSGEDKYTTAESERLLRLPLYHGLSPQHQQLVVESIFSFFKQ